ncbi:ubiquitin carboxyl-terminal hydrolase 31 isoform X2 [Tetranychus urticae]|uniref:ubiquitin carboxyl-terminal hydrolase 31 isoform X2 n=1 Tax=Tetranychus urticae TaxID=32264 RepID=UPI00077BC66D|nr:ubiquitin carboxyl-terminal hydrolase 31 isoform X2 [Tetranychus urticae]
MVNHHQHQRSQSFFSRLIRNLSSHSLSNSSYHNGSSNVVDHHSSHHRQSREKSSTLRSSKRHPRHASTYATMRHQLSSSQSSQDVSSKLISPSPSMPQPIESKPLAICGIKNHGNTCFMNAILQCLSNTDLLAEYFVMSHYKIDLVKHNQLNLCKYGSHGEVTSQCALVFKSLWTNSYSPDISNKFKHLVSKHCKQYEGSDQHDAQEFLFFLLDIFHEDLNIATKKKSKKLKQIQKSWNKPDELVAAETLAYHMRCDSSFIHDLFQAQLCSSLVCRSCNNYSNTFDPYMCLSLPVPIKRTHTVIINVSYLDDVTKIVRMVVAIEAQATLRELRDKISRLVKIPERQLVLLIKEHEVGLKELIKDKLTMHEILEDVNEVEVEAIETPAIPDWTSGVYSSNGIPTLTPSSSPINFASSQPLTLLWVNRVGIGSESKVFGPFFSCTLPRESSFKEIQHWLMKSMSPILRKTCDLAIIKDSTLFRLKVVDGLPGKCYLPEDVDHPLYMPTVDKALSHCEESDYRGPIHLKLIIEWDLDLRQTLLVDDDDIITIIDDPNIEFVKARNEMANTASLKDCFEMYFREERLGADNAWMCPACKRRQQCIKKLSLWSTPDIFIIHLKRFRQASNSSRTKLTTLVSFPLSGLDMNPYLSNRNNNYGDTVDFVNNNNLRNSSSYLPSPWRRPSHSKSCSSRSEDNVYHLYAVCNHHGNMQAGHYTAYCRNIVDGKWYSFDDQNVSPISEKSVVTSDAYILFYQRSTLSFISPINSCSGSSNGSSSTYSTISSNRPFDHWTYHLSSSISNRPSPVSCNSQDNLSSNSHPNSDSSLHGNKSNHQTVSNYNQPSRGARAYSTLPSRGSNDATKALLKDSRSVSPPVKRSQINSYEKSNSKTASLPRNMQSIIPPQQKQLIQPKNDRNHSMSNGRLTSPTHKEIHVDTGRSPRFKDDLFSCFVGILS